MNVRDFNSFFFHFKVVGLKCIFIANEKMALQSIHFPKSFHGFFHITCNSKIFYQDFMQ